MDLLQYALGYAELGWSVLPMVPTKKVPYIKWKQFQEERAYPDLIKEWWTVHADAQIGVVTGKISNLIVFDFDSEAAVDEWRNTVGDIPQTVIQKTKRGIQVLFSCPTDVIRNQAGVIKDVDVRGEGGLIVVAPSMHKSGTVRYEWTHIDPIEHGLDDLLPIPQSFLDKIRETQPKTSSADTKDPNWVQEDLKGTKSGNRNVQGTRLAGYFLRQLKGNKDAVLTVLNGWNYNNDPPLKYDELKKIVESVASRQGIDELRDAMGTSDFYQLEKWRYPDGKGYYLFYVNGMQHPVECDANVLLDLNKFRVRWFEVTEKVLPEMKRHDWFKLIEHAVKHATLVQMSDEETDTGVVLDIIAHDLRNTYDHPENMVHARCVAWNGTLYAKLGAIMQNLVYYPTQIKTTRRLGQVLRHLGFEVGTVRLNGKMMRAFTRPMEKFSRLHNMQSLQDGETHYISPSLKPDTKKL